MENKHTEFGIYCIKLRADKGWNQNVIAKRAGCTQAYISDIESGKNIPNFEVLVNIFRAYELNRHDTQEFFSKALKSFKGNMAFKIKNGIIPDDLLCDFLGCYLAADGKINHREQIEMTLNYIEQIKMNLSNRKKVIENKPFVDVGDSWEDPLSVKKMARSKSRQ